MPDGHHHSREDRARRPHGMGKPNSVGSEYPTAIDRIDSAYSAASRRKISRQTVTRKSRQPIRD